MTPSLTFFLVCVTVLTNIYCDAVPKKWPSEFPRCYRDDPNLNKCMVDAAIKMKPFLTAGIPEFNVPPISPFLVPIVTIDQGTDSASFKITLTNLTIIGFDTYEFDTFDFDVEKLYFDCQIRLGTTHMKGNYEVKGKILSVPIEGSGLMSNTIVSSNGTIKQNIELIQKNGLSYMDLKEPKIAIQVGEVKNYEYTGLFDGNDVLSRAADKVIRDNARELIEEVKPAIEKIIQKIVLDIQRKTLGKIPYDDLYPTRNL